jgi:LysR family transcriptional activator of nhaA
VVTAPSSGAGSAQRVLLDQWFHSVGLHPTVVGEFDDPALMNVFGQDGVGVFPAPSAIESDLVRRFQVKVIGRVPTLRQRFYALSVERRLKHPAVSAISEAARKEIFA